MKGKDIIYTAEEYSKDELTPPQWLTKAYLKNFLQKHHNDDSVEIKDYHVSPASKKGDHYASIMFRIEIEYKIKDCRDKELSIILKTLQDEDCPKNEMFQASSIFETEISIYQDMIPKFEDVLKKHGDNTVLGAKMLYSSVHPRKVIIFEDLAIKNFISIGLRSPTLEESKMGLVKLAKWHAVGYKLHLEGDETISKYHEGGLNMPNVETMEIFTDGINQFINLLQKDSELQEYVPIFEKLRKKNILKQCIGIYNLGRGYRDKSSSEIYVLNHGDFHAKNMMFKMDEFGISKDVAIIDFQLCVWGPVVIDVLTFIYLMLDPDTRLTKRDEIIRFYFTNFVETLKSIDFKGPLPKLTDLHIDLIKYKYLEINMLVSFLPFIYGITSKKLMNDLDTTSVFESPEAKLSFYENPEYIEEVKIQLPQLLYKGYLDVE